MSYLKNTKAKQVWLRSLRFFLYMPAATRNQFNFAKMPAKRFKQLLMSTPGSTGRLPCSFQHRWLSCCPYFFVVKNDLEQYASITNIRLVPIRTSVSTVNTTNLNCLAPAYGTWQGFTLWPAARKSTTLRAFLELFLWPASQVQPIGMDIQSWNGKGSSSSVPFSDKNGKAMGIFRTPARLQER